MADAAPQVMPLSAIPPPASPPSPKPTVAPEPVADASLEAEMEKKLKEAEDAKEKELEEKELKETEAREKAAKESAPEPATGITRTFTTHAGQTVTVVEVPNATKHDDAPATVPEADHTIVTKQDQVEKVGPVKESAAPVPLPTKTVVPIAKKAEAPAIVPVADHTVVENRPVWIERGQQVPATAPVTPTAYQLAFRKKLREKIAERRRQIATAAEQDRSIDDDDDELAAAPISNKAASTKTVTINSDKGLDSTESSASLPAIDREIGIFSQFFASKETTLNVQIIFRTDGITSQAFTDDHGTPIFTLDRKPSLLEDKELRDKSRMFILGIHKRRFRRPRQWHVKTGSDHGIRVKSSWKHRDKSLMFYFTNQPDGKAVRMLLEGKKLHLTSDVLSPVVAVIEPTKLRVAKGLDLSVACVACAVRSETQEARSGGSLRSMNSMKGSFTRRWGK